MDPATRPSIGLQSPPLIRVLVVSERIAVMNRLRNGLSDAPDLLVLGPPVMPMRDLLESLKIYRPDVVLLDQRVLRVLGDRALERFGQGPYPPRVLLVCDEPQPKLAGLVLKRRFHGYIGSDEAIAALTNAIRSVFRGELWLSRLALADALYGPPHTRGPR